MMETGLALLDKTDWSRLHHAYGRANDTPGHVRALAIVRATTKHCVHPEWSPSVVAAFADGAGSVQTDSQRRFHAALVDRTALWDPHFGNSLRRFRKAGLAYDRAACRSLVARH